jgi:hypothetical protein
MIDLTILFTIVVALAIYGVLNTLSQYVSIKWFSYSTRKKLDQEYTFLMDNWEPDCDDDCEVCEEETEKAVKKTARRKVTRK